MADERVPDLEMTIRLPKKRGKKSVKIECFLIEQFRSTWSQAKRKVFEPEAPFRKDDFDEFWQQPLYRVRLRNVDEKYGKWFGKLNYTFYSRREVFEIMESVEVETCRK